MNVTENVDLIDDVVDTLSDQEKFYLVKWLKEDLGENFGTEPTEEFPRGISVEVDVDIDEAEVIDDMTSWERERLYEELHEEFGVEPDEPEEIFTGGTLAEEEFGKALTQLWEDRWMLTNEQKARITAITKESFV